MLWSACVASTWTHTPLIMCERISIHFSLSLFYFEASLLYQIHLNRTHSHIYYCAHIIKLSYNWNEEEEKQQINREKYEEEDDEMNVWLTFLSYKSEKKKTILSSSKSKLNGKLREKVFIVHARLLYQMHTWDAIKETKQKQKSVYRCIEYGIDPIFD